MANTNYEVMVACHEKLIDGIKHGADPLAGALFQSGVLSDAVRDEIYEEHQPTRKARQLVSFLEDKIKSFPWRYNDLMRILREKSELFPQFGSLAGQLEDKRAELLQEARSLGRSNLTLNSEQTYISGQSVDDDKLYMRFECSCGECSIQEFLEAKNCPNSPSRSPPQLSLWSTDTSRRVPTEADMRYTDYKIAITERNQNIQAQYRALLSGTMNKLKARHFLHAVKDQLKLLITPPGARRSQYPRMYSRNVRGRLRDLQSYSDLQNYLEDNFCSWFNVSLVVNLREVLLGKGDAQEVLAYKEQLTQYLTRCCFKFARYDEHQHQNSTEIVCRVFTDFREIEKRQMKRFEQDLHKIISLPKCKRKVDEKSGDLILTVERDEVNQTTEDDINPVTISLAANNEDSPELTQSEQELDRRGKRMHRELESGQHHQKTKSSSQVSRLLKIMVNTILVLLLFVIAMGVSSVFFGWIYMKIYSFTKHNVLLDSKRVYADSSTELHSNITVSDLSSLTFSTQSSSLIHIYITDCKPQEEFISKHYILQPRKTLIFARCLSIGSSITITIKTMSGAYHRDCSDKLLIFDNWKDTETFRTTGTWIQPYEELCISEPTQSLFTPQKMSSFYFILSTLEKMNMSMLLSGHILECQIRAGCSISNATNKCLIGQNQLASETTVCSTAISSDSETPYSVVDYSHATVAVPLWKKILYPFLVIALHLLGCIVGISGQMLLLGCLKSNKIAWIILSIVIVLGLILMIYGTYKEILLFIDIYKV